MKPQEIETITGGLLVYGCDKEAFDEYCHDMVSRGYTISNKRSYTEWPHFWVSTYVAELLPPGEFTVTFSEPFTIEQGAPVEIPIAEAERQAAEAEHYEQAALFRDIQKHCKA